MLRPPLRPVATALLCAALVVGGLLGSSPAAAQGDGTTTTAAGTDGQSPAGNILPRPDSGQAPDSPNDPGGWQQYLVFGAIFAGLGVIVALVVRESRHAKARTRT